MDDHNENQMLAPSYLFCVMQLEDDKVWVKIQQPCDYANFEAIGIYFFINTKIVRKKKQTNNYHQKIFLLYSSTKISFIDSGRILFYGFW